MIIDQRKNYIGKGEFWAIPKNVFADKDITLEARVLFGILFTRMNGENTAWPGQKYLANLLGVGERSIRRYLEELKENGLIEVERIGLTRTNRYHLTGQIGRSRADTSVLSRADTAVADHIVREQNEDNSSNNIASQSDAGFTGKDINDLIDQFQHVNPNWHRLFKIKTERMALERMIHQHGREKVEKMIKVLPHLIVKPFCPKVTTPYQLEKKLGELVAFWKQEQNRTKKAVGVAF